MTIKVGTRRVIEQVYLRYECENCGEPATSRHTYLMPGARTNPQSAAYGRDDVSWCSDHEVLTCDKCTKADHEESVPYGYRWCASFSGERFLHMLHFWSEVRRTDAKTYDAKTYLVKAISRAEKASE